MKRQGKRASGAAALDLEGLEQRLAEAAAEKIRAGTRPSREERAALRRVEKARDEELRRQHFGAIAKKEWRKWSGRQQRTIDEQAERYGIPLIAATIDLPAVVRWLHDFLAEHKHKLAGAGGDDPMLAGSSSPALEQYRAERAKIARLERLEREKQLVPRELVHEQLTRLSGILRGLGEQLQRTYGSDAQVLLDEALEDWQRGLDQLSADDAGDAE